MLLFSLMWGDFCFVLMENVIPSILLLKLEHLGVAYGERIGFFLHRHTGTLLQHVSPLTISLVVIGVMRPQRSRQPSRRALLFVVISVDR